MVAHFLSRVLLGGGVLLWASASVHSAVVFSDNFDDGLEGSSVVGREPPVGFLWQNVTGSASKTIQAPVNNGGKALDQTRGATGGSIIRALADTTTGLYAPDTVYKFQLDGKVSAGATMDIRIGNQTNEDFNLFTHPGGLYYFYSSLWEEPQATVVSASNEWDTIEIYVSLGAEFEYLDEPHAPATIDAYITPSGGSRTQILDGVAGGNFGIGGIARFVLANGTASTSVYWDNLSIETNPIPEPAAVSALAPLAWAALRRRRQVAIG